MDEPCEQFSLANKNRKIENGTDWKELQECMLVQIWLSDISDISDIKVNEVAKSLGLGEEEFWRSNGPVDILIGINHPRLHTGETRQTANLVARH